MSELDFCVVREVEVDNRLGFFLDDSSAGGAGIYRVEELRRQSAGKQDKRITQECHKQEEPRGWLKQTNGSDKQNIEICWRRI